MLGYVLHKVKLKNLITFLIILTLCYYLKQKLLEKAHGKVPVLLWWTPMILEDSQLINCDKSTCLLTRNREYQTERNLAILFYGSNFNISDLPLQKTKQWAIFHEESPRNQAVFLSNKTWELFDITSTFSRYSHFPLTLHYLKNSDVLLDKTHFIDVEDKNTMLNQIAPVLYIQSDCDTPNDRDDYVAELMKFIKIDSYGSCLNNRKFPERSRSVGRLQRGIFEVHRSIQIYNRHRERDLRRLHYRETVAAFNCWFNTDLSRITCN